MILKRLFAILLMMCVLACLQAQTSIANGYTCTHGVDSSKWVRLINPTVIDDDNLNDLKNRIPIGFEFYYFGYPKSWVKLSKTGSVTFDNQPPQHFGGSSASDPPLYTPSIFPFGNGNGWLDSTSYWKYKTMGNPGNRMIVLEYCGTTKVMQGNPIAGYECTYQIQLREYDNSVRIVYGNAMWNDIPPDPESIMLTESISLYISVENHLALASDWQYRQSWPGVNHYYNFVPLQCLPRATAYVNYESPTSARVHIQGSPHAASYKIEYGYVGFAPGSGTVINTVFNQHLIGGLFSHLKYDIYVTPLCTDGTEGIRYKLQYSADCLATGREQNQITYWDLHRPNVTCSYRDIYHDTNIVGIIDYGYSSYDSRHTVHTDPTETDPRTDDLLSTIPPNHCYSVRLGNWRYGPCEREQVKYRLHIDTNNYDLLLFRFAIVEMLYVDPTVPFKPTMTFGIYDTNGVLLDSCYYANLIYSDSDEWDSTILYNTHPLRWHPWKTVGMDMTPFHGMDIVVCLNNIELNGQHYVSSTTYLYTYYTLETGFKHIQSTYCGASSQNVLTAPEGFAYRWYRADNPDSTLGTSQSLVVTDSGLYYCQASYLFPNSNCSMLLSAFSDSRVPVADFGFDPQNDCGSLCRMVNRSYVSRHGQPTGSTCDSYRWVFDDGTISTIPCPYHQFSMGSHDVTLFAMLSNGNCVDSVTYTIQVDPMHDTLVDSVCAYATYRIEDTVVSGPGTYLIATECGDLHLVLHPTDTTHDEISRQICWPNEYVYGTASYSDSGDYVYPDIRNGCPHKTLIHLSVMPSYQFDVADTFQLGQVYAWHGHGYRLPGIYVDTLTTAAGCDSIYTLQLSSIERYDTIVCDDALPLNWRGEDFESSATETFTYPSHWGVDSIVVLSLTSRPSYHHDMADTFQLGQTYLWQGRDLQQPGVYVDTFATVVGCDSIYMLRLSSIEWHDTLVCDDALPLHWRGAEFSSESADTLFLYSQSETDSIVVLDVSVRMRPDYSFDLQMLCDGMPYYSIPITDSLRYQWESLPFDSSLVSLFHFAPEVTTRYIFQAGYPDEPSCPIVDTLLLAPLQPIEARLVVQSEWVSDISPDLIAYDRSVNIGWRKWYVNGVLQQCSEQMLQYQSGVQGDSIIVMLVVGLDNCVDTAYYTVRVHHQELLWFPNVFTPTAATNNCFRGYGVYLQDYSLKIFTRWGSCFWETTNIDECWDGTRHGVPLPQGSYVYLCRYSTDTGEKHVVYGTVTLVR